MSAKDYGPDIAIPAGKVGEVVADSYVDDATGRTYHIAGGGALIVRMLPAVRAHRPAPCPSSEWTEERKSPVRAALDSWATDPEQRGLKHWARVHGTTWGDLNAAIYESSRVSPPLRAHYLDAKRRQARFRAEQDRASTAAKKGRA